MTLNRFITLLDKYGDSELASQLRFDEMVKAAEDPATHCFD